jgi:hypothetical protein
MMAVTELRRERLAQMAGARRELAAVERRLQEILRALSEGYRSEAWKAELVTLDARKAALTITLVDPPVPAYAPADGRGLPPEGDDARRRPRA